MSWLSLKRRFGQFVSVRLPQAVELPAFADGENAGAAECSVGQATEQEGVSSNFPRCRHEAGPRDACGGHHIGELVAEV